jgi:hypothetical protein
VAKQRCSDAPRFFPGRSTPPDDSSPHYYLRHRSCTTPVHIQIEPECLDVDLECQDADDWAKKTNSPRGVQKHDIADGVDLPLTTNLQMFPETVEPIGEDQKQLYHELALYTDTCSPADSTLARAQN